MSLRSFRDSGGGATKSKIQIQVCVYAPKSLHIPDFNNLTANLNFGLLEMHFIPLCASGPQLRPIDKGDKEVIKFCRL